MSAMRQKFQGDKTPLHNQYTVRDYLPELNRVGKTILEDEQSCWIGSSLKVIAAVWKGINTHCNDTAFTYYSSMESDLVRFILGVLKSEDIDMIASSLKIVVNMTATVTAVCDNFIGKKLFRYLNAVISNDRMRQSPLVMYRLTWILGNLACENANTVRSIFKHDLWNRTITIGIKTCEYARKYSADYTMFFILMWANNIILKRMKTVCVELSVADVDALNNFARVMVALYGKDESKKQQLTAMVYFLSCIPDDYFRDVIFGDAHIIEQTLKMGQSELRKYYKSIE
eukprot:515885_1